MKEISKAQKISQRLKKFETIEKNEMKTLKKSETLKKYFETLKK